MVDIPSYKKRKAKKALSRYGMVSTASRVATEAGVKMLEKGGNAVDAAVAAAFCLGVTEPQASGLGGQSMVLLHLGEKNITIALDGSSRSPFCINPMSIPSEPLKSGITATTVPSTPATLGYLLEKYGSMTLAEVLEPAIKAAAEGFKLTALQHNLLARESSRLLEDPLVKEIFFKNNHPLSTGRIVRQPQLAACLEKMALAGWQDFYLGEVASAIIKDMETRGGLISRADLSQLPIPIERQVLWATYRKLELATFPPPGAGRALVQILNTLENFTPEELVPETPLWAVILAMTFRAALRNREKRPVDPALYPQTLDKWMLDKEYASRIAQRIKSLTSYLEREKISFPTASGETTHLSVADAYGNLVGITQSIEQVFGAKTMAQGLGFFYNNYMSAFDYKDVMHPYYLLPGSRPWSSVAPTLIFREKVPRLLLGSPGSERISTTLAQVILRFFDAGQDLAAAIEGPRLHAGSSGRVLIERKRFDPEVVETLTNLGFEVSKRGAYSFYLGCVQAVLIPEVPGENYCGVSDPRRDGSARGPEYVAGKVGQDEDSHHI